MTDDDVYLLSLPEVAARLGVDNQAVRDWLRSNDLRITTKSDGSRGVDAESVEALATALAMPEQSERDDALFRLRERNSSSEGNPTV